MAFLEWWTALSNMLLLLFFLLLLMLFFLILLTLWSQRSRYFIENLDTRSVLITGCDSGFGWELCRRLDLLGVTVFAGCLYPDGEGASRLTAACTKHMHILPLDVTSEWQVTEAVSTVTNALGDRKLWALVNNAGVVEVGEVELTPLHSFERTLEVNTLGVLRVTKAFLPLIRASKGRIITVVSPLGRTSFPLLSPYCISKSATIALCDSLRVELKKWSVSVHTVEPTAYKTDINNTDVYRSQLAENFSACDPSVKASYGEDYHLQCAEQFECLDQFSKSLSSISEVVEEMVNACIGCNPGVRIIPGFNEKIIYNILPYLPIHKKDEMLHKLLQSKLRLPKQNVDK